ncbi:MAG TPA: hypothetical protein VG106_11755, partial [Vicinamibacterales bacterium]|nr:hypothetical protein [Vicinamibacterales bacterium]
RAPVGVAAAQVRAAAAEVERFVSAEPGRDWRGKFTMRLAQIRDRLDAKAPSSPAPREESPTRA